ncbi:MAG: DNA mismatch endonuclease Vsr [Eggerthellales bacterium]|nr:DNA mismatch endonuclease Vsr [Eggerthellales bacterium]
MANQSPTTDSPAEGPSTASDAAKPSSSAKPKAPTTDSPVVRKVMKANKRANTKPEQIVRGLLRHAGFPGYRLQWKKCPGHPDIAYPGRKIAIFVNGCFWHRCPICNMSQPKTHSDYWETKFARNVQRDAETRAQLEAQGWTVVNIWEHELKGERTQDVERYLYEVVSLDDPQERQKVVQAKELRDATEERRARNVQACYQALSQADIPYQRFTHKPVTTMQNAQKLEARMNASVPKNLLLAEKGTDHLFLYTLPGDKKAPLKELARALGTARLSFASDADLEDALDVEPGRVSMLALMNDSVNRVQLVLDAELQDTEALGFHPLTNKVTLRLETADVFERLPQVLGHEATIVSLPTD